MTCLLRYLLYIYPPLPILLYHYNFVQLLLQYICITNEIY